MESVLVSALMEVAGKRDAQVIPENIKIEGKPFTEYVISKKRFPRLIKRILARAYIEHGFDGETGEYTEITIAKVPEIPDSEFYPLRQKVDITVNLEDYETAKARNFNRRLGGP